MKKSKPSQSTLKPHHVAKTARELLGTRYVHQGRTPSLGLDCVGLVLWALQENGWTPGNEAIHRANYRAVADDDMLVQLIKGEAVRVRRDAMQESDLLLFHWREHAFAQHVGLVSRFVDGVPYFVHSLASRRGVVEHALRDEWLERLVSVWRLKAWAEAETEKKPTEKKPTGVDKK